MLSTPKTSVRPTATTKSHDASMRPSMTMVATKSTGSLAQRRGWETRPLTVAPSIALGAGEALRDPLLGFDAGRRIDAFGSEALDVDEAHAFRLIVPLGAADGVRLDRLMPITQRHLDVARGR